MSKQKKNLQKSLSSIFIPDSPSIGFVVRRDKDGREIVGRLKENLTLTRNKVAALSGAGGVGKTVLAAEAARELRDEFGGRIVWSSAEAHSDFTLSTFLDDIATQLGRADLRLLMPEAKGAEVRALVADLPTLVVLDNYETIQFDAQQRIEAWLKHALCSALLTSRQMISEIVSVGVAAMSREEAEDFLKRMIARTQGAQIFSAEIRQRIYETAEANPYVMQLVVGQIDAAQEPQTVLEELQHGEGYAAERVFDRSFNLPQLSDDGRAALLALALFAPSATRNALAEVAGFGDDSQRLNEAVKNLRALWLIKGIDQNSRFIVEGLTRSLAAARLSKDARANEFRQRFVAYFVSYAEAHAQPLPKNYNDLEAERGNLLNATDMAFAHEDWESVMRMAFAIANVEDGLLSVRGYWDECLRIGELALKAARSSQNENRIAELSHNVAIIYQLRGELDEARRLYNESLEINKRLGDQSGIAITLHQLGKLAQTQGEIEEARRLYNESLEIKTRLGNQSSIAISLHNLAALAQAQGEVEEARRLYNESLEITEKLSDQSGIASTFHQLGRLAQDQGEIEEARRLYNESLEIKKKLGNQSGIAVTLHQLAMLAHDQGAVEEARGLYNESLEIEKRLGDQSGIASTLGQLGLLAAEEGNREEAVRLMREALSIFEKLKSPYAEIARRNLEGLEGKSS